MILWTLNSTSSSEWHHLSPYSYVTCLIRNFPCKRPWWSNFWVYTGLFFKDQHFYNSSIAVQYAEPAHFILNDDLSQWWAFFLAEFTEMPAVRVIYYIFEHFLNVYNTAVLFIYQKEACEINPLPYITKLWPQTPWPRSLVLVNHSFDITILFLQYNYLHLIKSWLRIRNLFLCLNNFYYCLFRIRD